MKAKSIKGKSAAEIQTALQKSMSDGFKPTLAIVFISIKQDFKAVCDMLDKHDISIFGATSCGEFIDGEISQGAIAILLIYMDPSNFMILLEDYYDKEPEAVAKELAGKANAQFKNPSFIISNSFELANSNVIGEPIVKAIEEVCGTNTIIWGGNAGDDFMFRETVVFTNHQSTKRGILLLVLNGDKVAVKGLAASGQKPVGTEKMITKTEGDWVHEIENQPAAEMVLKFLGLNLTQEEAETFNPSSHNVIISVSREKGDPVMRGVGVFNWKNKSILIMGSIKEGDKIHFTLPPDFEVVEEVSKNADRINKEEIPDADALLMFSCIGRLDQFGPLIGDEIEGVRKVFNVPMAGFFTYGEFGRTNNGSNEFHNSTCCWVALKEK